MANRIADVKSVAGNAGASSQALAAFTVNPAAGDLIVVAFSSFDSVAGTTHAAPTDSAGNTYTQIGSTRNVNVAGTTKLSLWYAANVTGGSSFIVTLHATSTMSQMSGAAWLVKGAAAAPYNSDTTQVAATTGADPASGTSSATPASGSFFLGAMANSGTTAVTDGSGWNALVPDLGVTPAMITAARLTDNATAQDLYTEYDVDAVALNATWTEVSDTYAAIVASFAPLSPSSDGGGTADSRWRAFPSTTFSQVASTAAALFRRSQWAEDTANSDPSRDARADDQPRLN